MNNHNQRSERVSYEIKRTPEEQATYQRYYDLYDRLSVQECRKLEQDLLRRNQDHPFEPGMDPAKAAEFARHFVDLALWFTAGDRWSKREETVRSWVRDEEEEQRRINIAVPPREIVCRQCGSMMSADTKLMHDGKVLFVFRCPRGCPNRALFEDGTEFDTAVPCPECKAKDVKTDRDVSVPGVVIRYTCVRCRHSWTQDFSTSEERADPDFEKDRARFCFTPEEGTNYSEYTAQMADLMEFQEEEEEKKRNQDLYDAAAKLRMLTVLEVEKVVSEALGTQGYVRFALGAAETRAGLFTGLAVPFTVHDGSGRLEDESVSTLKKIVEPALADTNWSLMKDGLSCQLGSVNGQLKGVTEEKDKMELVKRRMKHKDPLTSSVDATT